jgi:hypothetical protein
MPLAIRDDVVYENFKPIVVLTLPCIVHYVKLHLIIAFSPRRALPRDSSQDPCSHIVIAQRLI